MASMHNRGENITGWNMHPRRDPTTVSAVAPRTSTLGCATKGHFQLHEGIQTASMRGPARLQ
jgi:hypothetical protein